MIRYPDRAIPALVRLFRRLNDITIFVEDATYTNMYQAYFERVLSGSARIKRIFPLNGRNKVIEAARSGKYKKYAPCLFIIDGDLDLLLGIPDPGIPNLYRLSHYCAENLLISHEAAIEIGFESTSDDPRSKIRRRIAFGKWSKRVVSLLFPLFTKYAVAHHFKLPITTASYNVHQLCEGKAPNRQISSNKVKSRIRDIESEILRHISMVDMKSCERTIKLQSDNNHKKRMRYISGKTYLLPLLILHLRQVTKLRDTEMALHVRLARHANLDVDPGLVTTIRSLI